MNNLVFFRGFEKKKMPDGKHSSSYQARKIVSGRPRGKKKERALEYMILEDNLVTAKKQCRRPLKIDQVNQEDNVAERN